MTEASVAETQGARIRRTFRKHEAQIKRQIDGTYKVPSLSRKGIEYTANLERNTCSTHDGDGPGCERTRYYGGICIHQRLAQVKDSKLRIADAKKTEEARVRSMERSKNRIRFSSDQVAANLSRMAHEA